MSRLECSLCAKVIQNRKVVDPQHAILCTACAVDKCPKCPLGARGLPKQLTDGHECVIMVNTATTRPPGRDSKAERLAKGWKACDSKLPGGRERLKASGHTLQEEDLTRRLQIQWRPDYNRRGKSCPS